MNNFLEALRIISSSWPIAAMLIAACGGVAIIVVVRNTNNRILRKEEIRTEEVRNSKGLVVVPKDRDY